MPCAVTEAVRILRDPRTIRGRAEQVLTRVRNDHSAHFTLNEPRLDDVATWVANITRERYPDLNVPLHSRWRHFVIAGEDRWARLGPGSPVVGSLERARAAVDLVVVSVLLDAGAGAQWCFQDEGSGNTLRRSEGLAAASFAGFAQGAFSADPAEPMRVDASALEGADRAQLAALFQATESNPLLALEGRAALLRALGGVLRSRPDLFGKANARPGNIVDLLHRRNAPIPAHELLGLVLEGFADIWPSRHHIQNHNLGDVWRLPDLGGHGLTKDLMPFHKLSQWLTYSLVEPLAEVGIEVTELDSLTGLAEYRNGGLFVDGAVLVVRDPSAITQPHSPGSEFVVEWRALTLGLLEILAPLVREKLGPRGKRLPLGAILEGGTWAAGRRLALERRPDGAPPIQIVTDGTVF